MDTVLNITYWEGPLCNGKSPFIFYLPFLNKHLYPLLEKNETACITKVELIYLRAWNYLCLKREEDRKKSETCLMQQTELIFSLFGCSCGIGCQVIFQIVMLSCLGCFSPCYLFIQFVILAEYFMLVWIAQLPSRISVGWREDFFIFYVNVTFLKNKRQTA